MLEKLSLLIFCFFQKDDDDNVLPRLKIPIVPYSETHFDNDGL